MSQEPIKIGVPHFDQSTVSIIPPGEFPTIHVFTKHKRGSRPVENWEEIYVFENKTDIVCAVVGIDGQVQWHRKPWNCISDLRASWVLHSTYTGAKAVELMSAMATMGWFGN